MSHGPLSVAWGEWSLDAQHAGAIGEAHVEIANTGTVRFGATTFVAYHWLDRRDNPIVPAPSGNGSRAAVTRTLRIISRHRSFQKATTKSSKSACRETS